MNLMPENISTYGGDLDSLTRVITYFAVIWFLAAFGVMAWFLFKYRKGANKKAAYITGGNLKELKYILFFLILVILSDFYIDVLTVGVWDRIKIQVPTADVKVGIFAYQWNWAFNYPGPDGQFGTSDDVRTPDNVFHVPVNKNIVFDLASKDVLHSFWVKELRLKQDAVPGRIIKGWFNATKIGKYEIMCAEICGIMHSAMKGYLVVESEEDYNKFLDSLYHPKVGINLK